MMVMLLAEYASNWVLPHDHGRRYSVITDNCILSLRSQPTCDWLQQLYCRWCTVSYPSCAVTGSRGPVTSQVRPARNVGEVFTGGGGGKQAWRWFIRTDTVRVLAHWNVCSDVPIGSRTGVGTALLRKMTRVKTSDVWHTLYLTTCILASYGQCLTDGISARDPARHSVKFVHVSTIPGKCNNH
jgi:hypothetical protein